MAQINLGTGDQGSPPTEEQKQLIKTALDISAFSTLDRDKLDGIEASADVTDTTNVVAALTAGTNITIAADGTISSSGGGGGSSLSEEEVQDIIGAMVTGNTESGITVTYDDSTGSIVFSVASQTDENFTTADHAKLDGIEASATADQTGAEIKAAYEGEADTNAFTDADHTKLDGIEASATADQTDSEIKTAYENNADTNAFTDADHTKLDGIETGADVTPSWVPSSDPSYATETYVDTEVANVIDSAPGTLDTLNELAEALGDDPNFATTVSNSIGTKLPLAGGTITGNIVMSGSETVDGRDLSVDGTKLDGIEAGATADQTDSEIKTAYENNADTNAFTDADHTKLDGIETGATADQTGAEIKAAYEGEDDTNAFTDADHTKLDGIETGADVTDTTNVTAAGALMDSEVTNLEQVKAFDSSDYAAALGADDNYVTDAEKIVIGNTSGTNTGDQDLSSHQLQPSEGAFVDGDKTKLDGIEAGATADQTGAEIKAAYEGESDTNAFTDADHTKLDGIETGATADQTGAEIKAAYEGEDDTNAFTDADHTKLDGIETGATADQTGAEIKAAYEGESDTNAFTDADHTKLDGIETGADVTDTTNVVAALTAGTNITIAGDGTISSSGGGGGGSSLSEEEVQDIVGEMVTGNTESGITVTYDDSDGTLDFSVASQTDENFTTADHTKLDGIETGADVTDATNVEAAGALMDSEVTNLAQVKAFDSSDFATAAQGTTADSAVQPSDIDTLSELNAVITDATLIDTTDSRLSDSRTCDNTFDSPVSTARTNLGLGTAAIESAEGLSPIGGIQPYAGSSSPTGWLVCDGSAVSRSIYADLFTLIGSTYGAGNGSTTFNLPDLQLEEHDSPASILNYIIKHGPLSEEEAASIGNTSSNFSFIGGAGATNGAAYNSSGVVNTIEYFDHTSTSGNALDKGDLTVSRKHGGGLAGSSNGYTCGGKPSSSTVNVIDFIDTSTTTGNATDVGDLTITRSSTAGLSGPTNGFLAGGIRGTTTKSNVIDFFDLTTTSGNATDRGDAPAAGNCDGVSSTQYGFFGVGFEGFTQGKDIKVRTKDDFEYIDLLTTSGNSNARGGWSSGSEYGQCGVSGSVYGFFCGGSSAAFTPGNNNTNNKIEFLDVSVIASGNTVDKGDLTVSRAFANGNLATDQDNGFIAGGSGSGGPFNVIDYIDTSTTTGNAADRGDLITASCAGASIN